jgi:hypothetical protein
VTAASCWQNREATNRRTRQAEHKGGADEPIVCLKNTINSSLSCRFRADPQTHNAASKPRLRSRPVLRGKSRLPRSFLPVANDETNKQKMLHTTAPSRLASLAAAPRSSLCVPANRPRCSSKHVCRTAMPQSAVSAVAPPSAPAQQNGAPQSTQTTTAAPKPDPSPAAGKEQKGYQWTKQWYPVAVEAALDPAVPHKVRP